MNQENHIKNNLANESEQSKTDTFHSMRSDTVDIAKKQGTSLEQIVASSQEKRKKKQFDYEIKKSMQKRKKFVLAVLLVFLLVVVIVVSGIKIKEIFYEYNTRIRLSATALIYPDIQEEFGIGGIVKSDFIVLLKEKIQNLGVESNNITHVFFTDSIFDISKNSSSVGSIIQIQKVLELMSTNTPPIYLLQSLEKEYMFGLYGVSKIDKGIFLILKTSNYDNAFFGMADWEKDMQETFAELFDFYEHDFADSFTDTTIANKNVRVAKQNNSINIIYSFIDSETILIATDEVTFSDVLGKYLSTELVISS